MLNKDEQAFLDDAAAFFKKHGIKIGVVIGQDSTGLWQSSFVQQNGVADVIYAVDALNALVDQQFKGQRNEKVRVRKTSGRNLD